ncbi:MAG: threonine--tRNA ligase, partial [Euryarchaeota archaeon]|nr:threonine--tRNA ligase [Euryarchaeota archaeon]
MKLLLIHSDFIEYEVKKKVGKIAEEITDDMKTGHMEEALTAFIAVEKPDEGDPDGAVARAATEIRKVAKEVKTDRIMLYPYAHLSSDLASPAAAVDVLKRLEGELAEFETKRSPFGWYKAFKISCKGHPLSELSRHVLPDGTEARVTSKVNTGKSATMTTGGTVQVMEERPEQESAAIKAEKTIKSKWYVLTPEGDLVDGEEFDFSDHPGLKTFYDYEVHGSRTGGQEPPHIKAMQDLELVDYEPGSDPGNFRWYPKGHLVKRLMEAHVGKICREQGGMQVETPIMYDYQHPALAKYLQRFPARQYVVKSEDKEFFLRFAACFGQYLIAHDATISYRHLPLRLFELTHYSFRREQRGELAGLKRLRTFTMPDMHTLAGDMPQAMKEFKEHFGLAMRWMEDLGFEYQAGVRFVRSFFDENRDFAVGLAK